MAGSRRDCSDSPTPVSPHFVDSPVQVPGRTVVRLPYPSDAGCRPRFCQFCRLPAVPRDVRREQRAPVHVRSSPTIDRTARQVEALAPLVGVASAGSISDAHRGAEDRSPPVELFERLYAFLRRFKPPTHRPPEWRTHSGSGSHPRPPRRLALGRQIVECGNRAPVSIRLNDLRVRRECHARVPELSRAGTLLVCPSARATGWAARSRGNRGLPIPRGALSRLSRRCISWRFSSRASSDNTLAVIPVRRCRCALPSYGRPAIAAPLDL